MLKRLALAFTVLLSICGFIIVNSSRAFDLSDRQQEQISFANGHDIIQGTLISPSPTLTKHEPFPIVLVVHGDGPQDRFSNDGYLPLFNALLDRGVAIYSWDKPGIKDSTGNWLSQTMEDRAHEVEKAYEKLRSMPEFKNRRIGVLGFSQAGWVVPKLKQNIGIDFLLLIGAAINWREQSFYYTAERVKRNGANISDVNKAVEKARRDFDSEFSVESASEACISMPCSRKDFERRNAMADSKADIIKITTPVMILSGLKDLNVNPNTTFETWNTLLPDTTKSCIRQIPNATHGLLNASWFNYQLPDEWPIWAQILFFTLGEKAYASSAIDAISGWIKDESCPL